MISLLKGIAGIRPPLRDIVPTELNEIRPFLYWADRTVLKFWLPPSALTMQGAFSYGGWHPFVEALNEGPEALACYYDRFRPADLASMYYLSKEGEVGEDQAPWVLPWRHGLTPSGPSAEKGLGAEHGVSLYGPATAAKLRLEFQRLQTTLQSVRRRGYRPDRFGEISGHFLVDGAQTRFFIGGGKHRAAVLAHMGWDRIPVVLKPHWARVVYSQSAMDWPLVRSGEVSEVLALRIFRSYFEMDGTRQSRLMGENVGDGAAAGRTAPRLFAPGERDVPA